MQALGALQNRLKGQTLPAGRLRYQEWFCLLQAMKALLQMKEKTDLKGWKVFQQQVNTLKLQRTRTQKELEEVQGGLFSAAQQLEAEIDDEAGAQSTTGQCLLASPCCRDLAWSEL